MSIQFFSSGHPFSPSGPPLATPWPRELQNLGLVPGSSTACTSCHTPIDGLGLGLENFDAIGAYRTQYSWGDAVGAGGTFTDGSSFVGLLGLADKLAQDPRAVDCMARKALTYALGRQLGTADDAYVSQLRDTWIAGGESLPALLDEVVHNDTFRMRRGEGP
jgi:hypothetical protein